MNKTKLDDRIENTLNRFLEIEPDRSQFALTYSGHDTALVANEATFAEKADNWIGILREIFLFGPGTFFLYLVTIAAIGLYPYIGLRISWLFWIPAFSFMTYAGSGKIGKINNLAVPATVIVMAALFSLYSSIFQSDLFSVSAIYVFPFVLIAAKLVQGWVSDKK